MNIVLAIILGSFFGYVLYLAGASSPRKLLAMLQLRDLKLMKIIVFGIGFASVLLSVSIMLGLIQIDHLHIKTMNLGVVIGGLLFGIGFGTVGTCPGTCVTASASGGGKKAIAAVVGGLVGAWLFSMSYGLWERLGIFQILDFGKMTLFSISDSFPAVFGIGPSGLLCVGVLFIIVASILPQPSSEK